jgi:hypothetical protein
VAQLAAGGPFFPRNLFLEPLMSIDPKILTTIPFSLVCETCDAGMDIETYEQAVAEGWTEIEYDPGLPQANFVGTCPECSREQASE